MPRRLARLAPARRSVATGLGILALAGGLYAALRETSAFAITHVEVSGAAPAVRAQVRDAARSFRGTNLLALDGAALESRVDALPTVESMTYDRAFPHTLRIVVVPERPVAVLHRGRATWLLSARGRVIARIPRGARADLPRVWIPTTTAVRVGGLMPPDGGLVAARALALAARLPARITTASLAHGALDFRLRSGLDLRLGQPNDLRLKLAIARRALPLLPAGTGYLDVSLPQRPVAGAANPQLSTGG
jgi:cell division protein FtsQ